MPEISEKELENHLLDNISVLELNIKECESQFNLGGYGVVDLIGFNFIDLKEKFIEVSVIELKKGTLDLDALSQLYRYKEGVVKFLEDSGFDAHVVPVLIGNRISHSDWVYTACNIPDLRVFTYDLNLETGISFKDTDMSGWFQTSEKKSPLKERVNEYFDSCEHFASLNKKNQTNPENDNGEA